MLLSMVHLTLQRLCRAEFEGIGAKRGRDRSVAVVSDKALTVLH
jgi:hypothetical protein